MPLTALEVKTYSPGAPLDGRVNTTSKVQLEPAASDAPLIVNANASFTKICVNVEPLPQELAAGKVLITVPETNALCSS